MYKRQVPGYDFLVNSVWPEIVRGLEVKLPSLFNPGNPDAFHEVILNMYNDHIFDLRNGCRP